jgi:ABC-type phosphate transport system substrate-binding protein
VTKAGAALVTLLASSLGLAAVSGAQDHSLGVKVVANAEGTATKITRDDLARVFLGKKTLWESGSRVMPAMMDEEASKMQPFLDQVLKKSVEQYRAYWKRLLFSGGGTAPRTFRNSSQVLEFVAKNPGAIGVVEPSAVDDRVKVVDVEG